MTDILFNNNDGKKDYTNHYMEIISSALVNQGISVEMYVEDYKEEITDEVSKNGH